MEVMGSLDCLSANCRAASHDGDPVVKMDCSNKQCPHSGFMHEVCYKEFEEEVLKFMRVTGRARSWSEEMRRNSLWTSKGYDIVKKFCKCRCGKGNLRRDLEWKVQPRCSVASPEGWSNVPAQTFATAAPAAVWSDPTWSAQSSAANNGIGVGGGGTHAVRDTFGAIPRPQRNAGVIGRPPSASPSSPWPSASASSSSSTGGGPAVVETTPAVPAPTTDPWASTTWPSVVVPSAPLTDVLEPRGHFAAGGPAVTHDNSPLASHASVGMHTHGHGVNAVNGHTSSSHVLSGRKHPYGAAPTQPYTNTQAPVDGSDASWSLSLLRDDMEEPLGPSLFHRDPSLPPMTIASQPQPPSHVSTQQVHMETRWSPDGSAWVSPSTQMH